MVQDCHLRIDVLVKVVLTTTFGFCEFGVRVICCLMKFWFLLLFVIRFCYFGAFGVSC